MMIRHEVLGTISRNPTTGVWAPIVDAEHAQVGIAAVSVSGLNVRVDFDFTADRILSAICGPDETLAKSCIIPGASCAVDHAIISLGKNGVQINQNTISNVQANIWLNFQLESDEV